MGAQVAAHTSAPLAKDAAAPEDAELRDSLLAAAADLLDRECGWYGMERAGLKCLRDRGHDPAEQVLFEARVGDSSAKDPVRALALGEKHRPIDKFVLERTAASEDTDVRTPRDLAQSPDLGLGSLECMKFSPYDEFAVDSTAASGTADNLTCSDFSELSESPGAFVFGWGGACGADGSSRRSAERLASRLAAAGGRDSATESWCAEDLLSARSAGSCSSRDRFASCKCVEVYSGKHQGKQAVVLLVDHFCRVCLVRLRCSREVVVLAWDELKIVGGPRSCSREELGNAEAPWRNSSHLAEVSATCSGRAVGSLAGGLRAADDDVPAAPTSKSLACGSIIVVIGGRHCGESACIMTVDHGKKRYKVQLSGGGTALVSFGDADPWDARPGSLDCAANTPGCPEGGAGGGGCSGVA